MVAAELANVRGRPREGEALARSALAELVERKADPQFRRSVLWTLAESLVAQGRFEEARAPLAEGMELARKANTPETFTVLDEWLLAQIEVGTGQRAAGIQRAERVRDALERVAGQPRAQREVARFLAGHRR